MNKEVIEIDINSILYTHLKERTLIEFNHWGIDIDEKEINNKEETPNLQKLIEEEVKRDASAYKNIKETDGLSYINLFEWRRVVLRLILEELKENEEY